MDCHAADFTATISADVSLKSAQERLSEIDQWIPIDGNDELPVGKLVESNSTGPLRLGFGAWRDLLLGCQFRIGSGELISAGGRTVKNVAGYDLTKLMVGQGGILGTIETMTVRTYRKPMSAVVARFKPSDQWIGNVIATPLRPRWTILTADALWCGWIDDEASLNFYSKLIAANDPIEFSRRSIAEDIAHRGKLWSMEGDYFRASVPPMEILKFVKSAELNDWSADAAFGVVIGRAGIIDTDRLNGAARAVGGKCTLFIGGNPPMWEPTAEEKLIILQIKRAVDSEALLRPLGVH
jgi:hypothetical protein